MSDDGAHVVGLRVVLQRERLALAAGAVGVEVDAGLERLAGAGAAGGRLRAGAGEVEARHAAADLVLRRLRAVAAGDRLAGRRVPVCASSRARRCARRSWLVLPAQRPPSPEMAESPSVTTVGVPTPGPSAAVAGEARPSRIAAAASRVRMAREPTSSPSRPRSRDRLAAVAGAELAGSPRSGSCARSPRRGAARVAISAAVSCVRGGAQDVVLARGQRALALGDGGGGQRRVDRAAARDDRRIAAASSVGRARP